MLQSCLHFKLLKSFMKVPISALREFLDLTLLPTQISDLLTSAGLEVEGIERTPFPFSGVVVGKVLAAMKHPEADRLQVATVFDGIEQALIIFRKEFSFLPYLWFIYI